MKRTCRSCFVQCPTHWVNLALVPAEFEHLQGYIFYSPSGEYLSVFVCYYCEKIFFISNHSFTCWNFHSFLLSFHHVSPKSQFPSYLHPPIKEVFAVIMSFHSHLLWVEQTRLSKPLLVHHVHQPPDHLGGPPLTGLLYHSTSLARSSH